MNARLATLATSLLACGLIAAGCGGSSDTTSTTSSTAAGATGASGPGGAPLTLDAFLKQGNAICKAGNQEINAAFQGLGQSPSKQEQIQEIQTTVVPSIQSQIDDIRALTPPEAIQGEVTRFLDDAQKILDQVKADPASIQGGAFKPINQEATAIGLKECAN